MEFHADTFEEMAELSKKHGMEMHAAGDEGHREAMETMKERMNDPAVMKEWYEGVKKEFEALPEEG